MVIESGARERDRDVEVLVSFFQRRMLAMRCLVFCTTGISTVRLQVHWCVKGEFRTCFSLPFCVFLFGSSLTSRVTMVIWAELLHSLGKTRNSDIYHVASWITVTFATACFISLFFKNG